MKVLVIPDVHLKPYIFDMAEDLMNKHNITEAVFVGDLVDNWFQANNIELYRETIARAIKFKKDHPTAKFCWGNHEVGYITGISCSGNSELHYIEIRELLKNYEKEADVHIAYCIDKILFSHAGFTIDYKEEAKKLQENKVYDDNLYAFMKDSWDSPLWARPDEWVKFYNAPQVIGHSPVKKICEIKPKVWDVDVFSTYFSGDKYGKEAFLAINTKTLETEIFEV